MAYAVTLQVPFTAFVSVPAAVQEVQTKGEPAQPEGADWKSVKLSA